MSSWWDELIAASDPAAGPSQSGVNAVPGGRGFAKKARALGWTRGRHRLLPWLIHIGAEGVPHKLTTADYRVATAVLGGVASFLSTHGRVLYEGTVARAEGWAAVETDAGPVEVRVYIPPPEDAG
jgi:hypothetical protein